MGDGFVALGGIIVLLFFCGRRRVEDREEAKNKDELI